METFRKIWHEFTRRYNSYLVKFGCFLAEFNRRHFEEELMEEIGLRDLIPAIKILYVFTNKISFFMCIFSDQKTKCQKRNKNSHFFPFLLIKIGKKLAIMSISFRNRHFRISHVILERVNDIITLVSIQLIHLYSYLQQNWTIICSFLLMHVWLLAFQRVTKNS